MFKGILRFIHPQRSGARLRWLNTDVAIGGVEEPAEWQSVYEAGVRAVVDLRHDPEDQRAIVRKNGMRYLRLCPSGSSVPSAAELQIVTSWVVERVRENGRVLIQDGHARFNDGLVAVASLVKGGLPAHLALLALQQAVPNSALDRQQNAELVRFAAAQPG